jgi:Na+/pantothenate symporter
VSRYIQNAHIAKRICSTQELINALYEEHEKSNNERKKMRLKAINNIFLGIWIFLLVNVVDQ